MKNILITGALGQIGSELTMVLRKRYGYDNVIASDIRSKIDDEVVESGPFEIVDCTEKNKIGEIVKKYRVDAVYHLAAILSAVAEEKPQFAWNVNINGLYYVL
ncbi:MAG TPA: NAD-dependent epimerase/dehydratase family protein, partial [bacterium]